MNQVEREWIVDCRGETCPVPLVEVRKAMRKGHQGDLMIVYGTHAASRKEIPMAARALGLTVEADEGTDTDWVLRIRL